MPTILVLIAAVHGIRSTGGGIADRGPNATEFSQISPMFLE